MGMFHVKHCTGNWWMRLCGVAMAEYGDFRALKFSVNGTFWLVDVVG